VRFKLPGLAPQIRFGGEASPSRRDPVVWPQQAAQSVGKAPMVGSETWSKKKGWSVWERPRTNLDRRSTNNNGVKTRSWRPSQPLHQDPKLRAPRKKMISNQKVRKPSVMKGKRKTQKTQDPGPQKGRRTEIVTKTQTNLGPPPPAQKAGASKTTNTPKTQ